MNNNTRSDFLHDLFRILIFQTYLVIYPTITLTDPFLQWLLHVYSLLFLFLFFSSLLALPVLDWIPLRLIGRRKSPKLRNRSEERAEVIG
ncbi:hypothetical protein O9H85_07385 [Paenibacillus filicis]|uniref:Acyltransferase n=1 Tax=Paenibacillus gyeongsangnamensis TaxID=3388067 RepID=A0ABT4Q5V2_9BACL|nr:hypothetical protein [Paenibacillus filicis]MCZ8512253.1 hypothetical protein [Paenibacillus filicis]